MLPGVDAEPAIRHFGEGMNDDGQQTLLGFFAPAVGVHLVPPAAPRPSGQHVTGGVVFERSHRARNYRLTLRRDGTAVAIIPARGSEREARRFVEQHREWLERARVRQMRRPRVADIWVVGTHVLWRGQMTEVRVATTGTPWPPSGATERPKVCLAADVF